MPRMILPGRHGPSAFLLRDPEGARASNGLRYHGAWDLFAPGGTIVRSPVDGVVVESRPSGGDFSGQVFGGVVKVQETDAPRRVWVMRHLEPSVKLHATVREGEPVGTVTPWRDAPNARHVHLEVWRKLSGGYRIENMIDPAKITYRPYGAPEESPPPRPFPPPNGDTLRLMVGDRSWAGWTQAQGPLRWIAAHGLKSPDSAISWRNHTWRGARDVTNVARALVRDYL